MPRCVIYARKSTESEDRQVLSIESQVRELHALAARQGIGIAEVLTESHSAKAPGRPVFGQLMRDVHRGRVQGIVAWKMDRLARNHLDTGAVLQALADGLLEQVVTSVTGEEHVKKSGLRFVYYHCTHRKTGVVCREPAVPARDLESQIARVLERLSLPEPVHAWLLRKSRGNLEAERLQRDQARASLERAAKDTTKQEEELLSLRLRGLVKDDIFLAKREELQGRGRDLDGRLHGASTRVEDVQRKIEAVFAFAEKAKEIFVSGTPVQKRMVLEAVGSNYRLRSRKVALTLKKPFQILADASAISNWCRRSESNRTTR